MVSVNIGFRDPVGDVNGPLLPLGRSCKIWPWNSRNVSFLFESSKNPSQKHTKNAAPHGIMKLCGMDENTSRLRPKTVAEGENLNIGSFHERSGPDKVQSHSNRSFALSSSVWVFVNVQPYQVCFWRRSPNEMQQICEVPVETFFAESKVPSFWPKRQCLCSCVFHIAFKNRTALSRQSSDVLHTVFSPRWPIHTKPSRQRSRVHCCNVSRPIRFPVWYVAWTRGFHNLTVHLRKKVIVMFDSVKAGVSFVISADFPTRSKNRLWQTVRKQMFASLQNHDISISTYVWAIKTGASRFYQPAVFRVPE